MTSNNASSLDDDEEAFGVSADDVKGQDDFDFSAGNELMAKLKIHGTNGLDSASFSEGNGEYPGAALETEDSPIQNKARNQQWLNSGSTSAQQNPRQQWSSQAQQVAQQQNLRQQMLQQQQLMQQFQQQQAVLQGRSMGSASPQSALYQQMMNAAQIQAQLSTFQGRSPSPGATTAQMQMMQASQMEQLARVMQSQQASNRNDNFQSNTSMMHSPSSPPFGQTPSRMDGPNAIPSPPQYIPRQNSNVSPHQGHPQPDTQILESQMMNQRRKNSGIREQQIKLAEMQRKSMDLSRYDGLMSRYEIDLVARIQITQFISADPFSDDYYYQVFAQLRRGGGDEFEPMPRTYTDALERSRRSVNVFNAQIERVVKEVKRRGRKEHQFGVDGALGKIAMISVRNPKKVLDFAVDENKSKGSPKAVNLRASSSDLLSAAMNGAQRSNRMETRLLIENIYPLILKLEQLQRREGYSTTGTMWPLMNEGDDGEAMLKDYILELWDYLGIENENVLTASDPTMIRILTVHKGRRLLPRLLRYVNTDHQVVILILLFKHIGTLLRATVLTSAQKASAESLLGWAEETESFLNFVAPAVVQLMIEAPWPTVVACLDFFLKSTDDVLILRSRVCQALLTMLLSRAELLKQQRDSSKQDEVTPFVSRWDELAATLWDRLQGRFLTFFPPLVYYQTMQRTIGGQVPIAGPTSAHLSSPVPDPAWIPLLVYALDDIYVWQFLASITVGSSAQHQHLLVAEVRSRIVLSASGYTKKRAYETPPAFPDKDFRMRLKAFETQCQGFEKSEPLKGPFNEPVTPERRKSINERLKERLVGNVNLFLNSVGLDASQISQ